MSWDSAGCIGGYGSLVGGIQEWVGGVSRGKQ
jgi:hypothetical protein